MDYAKYNMYEEELKMMVEQPYFGKVNNKMTVKKGEMAFLPCRVKNMGEGFMVSRVRSIAVSVYLDLNFKIK